MIDDEAEEALGETTEFEAWSEALKAPFAEVKAYDSYVKGTSPFDTHQGVKGLEFPRVMVVISDSEARGFLFSYDKLLGAKARSETDLRNEAQGQETSLDRTRRLFYVTCSRAENSLAIVAYAENPEAVRKTALREDWFDAQEIELID